MSKETKLLVGGIGVAVLGFFISLYFQKIWLGLFIALLVGVIFLGRLVSLSKKEFDSRNSYLIMYGIVALIILFNAIAFAHDYGIRNFQPELLLDIRKTIDRGIAKAEIEAEMIYVLGQYHQQERESVVETYRDLNPERLGEDGIFISDFDQEVARKQELDKEFTDDDNTNYYYEIDEEADELKVIVVTEVSLGEDPEFENYDGQTGQFEMMFTLSEEGVDYEVRN
jgi:hypothetical protein